MTDPGALLGFAVIGLAILAIELIIIGIARRTANRVPKAPMVQFAPPPGDLLTHALAMRADLRFLTAAIIDLAVRGHIRVLTTRGGNGTLGFEVVPGARLSAQEVRLLRALRPPITRPRQQRRYLRALAQVGIVVDRLEQAPDVYFLRGPGAFRGHTRKALSAMIEDARKHMKTSGLARPRTLRVHLTLLSLLFFVVLAGGGLLILGALANGQWQGAVIVGLVVVVFVLLLALTPAPMLRFTAQGEQLRGHLSGLRHYIGLAEAPRMQMMQSPQGALRTGAGELTPGGRALGLSPQPTHGDMVAQAQLDRYVLTERLLPYAIVFREERSWQQEFEHLGAGPTTHAFREIGNSLETLMAVLEILAVIGQVLRLIAVVASLGRST